MINILNNNCTEVKSFIEGLNGEERTYFEHDSGIYFIYHKKLNVCDAVVLECNNTIQIITTFKYKRILTKFISCLTENIYIAETKDI